MAHVTTSAIYEGDLKCVATHPDSDATLRTAAPVDNNGDGSSFSPTDLVGVALATCMLTTMGIVAARDGLSIEGVRAETDKHMVADPKRRIGRLDVRFTLPAGLDEDALAKLKRVAEACPVKQTLDPRTEVNITWASEP